MEILSETLVHIHEILALLGELKVTQLNTNEFIKAVEERFGCDVYFTSCSGQLFSREEIIRFLVDKQKIELVGDQIVPLVLDCTR